MILKGTLRKLILVGDSIQNIIENWIGFCFGYNHHNTLWKCKLP